MGFEPSRADPDLWMKKSENYEGYDCIAAFADDLVVVARDPLQYLNCLASKFNLKNATDSPDFFLGANWTTKQDNSTKISNEKCILEHIRKFEEEHGTIRKENVPAPTKSHPTLNHPETDTSPLLDSEHTAIFQSAIGACQWSQSSGRFDITFALSSLSRFAVSPRENHLKASLKILGYLKKHPKKGHTIDPSPFIPDFPSERVQAAFNHQYDYFSESIDPRFPDPLLDELDTNIFVDSNHGHDTVTGKAITGTASLVGRTPVDIAAQRQPSVQTATCGSESYGLKVAVEKAVTLRYHLRSMGVKVTKPTTICCDNKAVVTNTTEAGSTLKKKYLALSYHFCREHFAANVVDIRWIEGKHNIADAMTKALATTSFHTHMNKIMSNS